MKIGLLILFGLYLYKLFHNRSKEKREYVEAEQMLFENVRQILGENGLQRFKAKQIWIGMPQCLVFYSLGKPHKITDSEDSENIWHTYYYDPMPYQYAGETKYKYKKELSFHNGLLTHKENK